MIWGGRSGEDDLGKTDDLGILCPRREEKIVGVRHWHLRCWEVRTESNDFGDKWDRERLSLGIWGWLGHGWELGASRQWRKEGWFLKWKMELKKEENPTLRTVKYDELVKSDRSGPILRVNPILTGFDRVWPVLIFESGPTRFAEPTRKLVRVCELTREFDYHALRSLALFYLSI